MPALSDKRHRGKVQSQSRYGARGTFHAGRFVRALCLALIVLAAGLTGGGEAEAKTLKIIAFGDSLTAGLGLPASEAFPARLEAALRRAGHDAEIVNGGVSGDTASAGADRLDWTLGDGADGIIVELGANDALRGIDPEVTRGALDTLLARLKAKNIPVLLAGMQAPPNLGADYAQRFNAMFPDLAEKHGVLFYPFFLDGVAADAALNQPDGIHPNGEGVKRIVEGILPFVVKLVERAESAGQAAGN